MQKIEKKDISILIVEDEVILALGLEHTLQSYGYEVCGIECNGNEAIKHCFSKLPDIVLVDINLKGNLSGIDVAKNIWQTKKIPIIFLTSYCDEKTIKQCMECEPYCYLVKPCKDIELNVAIQTAIHKHKYFFKNIEVFDTKSSLVLINEKVKFHKGKNILYVDDLPKKLTGNEIKLIQILCEYKGETITFERIASYIWREELYDLGKLRTLVYRLKQKIDEDIIENIFETGYRLKVA
ncbi:response regulator [Halarcobacter ebronensis]|uniref:response regulator n=1 Tax=Halarcobacter ebronensis TaxID=1462615 RepID=UPI00155D8E27|nr:response regulator [Halarcobacter ebronensis]QKF82600.1 two-component system response regulator [Halarcobacter ebronensis]